MGDYYHSITWLEEAVSLFRVSYGSWNTEDEGSLEDALDHLAFSYFMVSPKCHLPQLLRSGQAGSLDAAAHPGAPRRPR